MAHTSRQLRTYPDARPSVAADKAALACLIHGARPDKQAAFTVDGLHEQWGRRGISREWIAAELEKMRG
jgi:hypothetical protein